MEIGEVSKSKTLVRRCNKKGHDTDRDRTKELELRSTTLIIQSLSFLFTL